MKKLLIISVLLTLTATLSAQQSIQLTGTKTGTDTQVSVQNIQVARTDQKTLLTMDFILDQLDVPSNRYRAFTPVIRSADGLQEQRLKTLIVSGRRQDIVFERDGIDDLYAANYDKIRRQNGQPQTYSYSDAADNQPWFSGANVYVECDLCGCGDKLKNDEAFLATLQKPDPYDLINLVDVVPAPAKKERNLHGSAYITFVVDKWEVKPDYMNNRRELRKITDTLDVMVADQNVSVRQVKIHGYASPESPYEHNKMLAENRAKSLTDYVSRLYNLPASVFAPAEATPENWDGLRAAVVDMNEQTLPHKQQILALIDDTSLKPDPKEARIKQQYPDEYRYLLREVYPGLRRSDYDISFNFSDFTLEQAKEVYKTKPYQLSVRELWDVAQTMEPGSPNYNKVLQQAVNIYPDDPVANLNLANVAIKQKDLLKAETLLERAGNSAEAFNARAVVAILQERYADANVLLQQASQRGLDVSKNMDAIRLLTK
jgi:outer membrane protein OmpA-like peptidoglycan-associated protein